MADNTTSLAGTTLALMALTLIYPDPSTRWALYTDTRKAPPIEQMSGARVSG